jgi:hypothetical protein
VSDGERSSLEKKRLVARIVLRVAALAVLAFPVLGHGDRAFAMCAWVAVPLTLLEEWAVRRGRVSYGLAFSTFVSANLLLIAAYLQTIYTVAVLTTGSIVDGVAAVETELAALFSASFPGVVVLVYVVECLATASMLALLVRVSRRWELIAASWFAVVVVAPFFDWAVLIATTPGKPPFAVLSGVLVMVIMCVLLLGIGSAAASAGLLFVYAWVEAMTRRLVAPQLTPSPPDLLR